MAVDVAVIGAGVSGLSCAAELARNGAAVVVFEAAERIGGRIRTSRARADGTPGLELGAQVVHGARNPLLALLGRAVVPETRAGSAYAVTGGRLVPIESLGSGGHPPWLVAERLVADPGPSAGSVADWLADHVPAADRPVAAEWFRQNWAGDPADLAATGLAAARRRESVGAGEFALAGGFCDLPRRLAGRLDVRLGHAVRRISWRAGRAELAMSAPGGSGAVEVETARAVVVTVPPPVVMAGRLVIEDLPAATVAAGHALGLGDAYCLVATLDRAAPQTSVVFDADGQTGFVRCYAARPDVLIVAKAGAAAAVRAAVAGGGLPGLLATALPWSAGARITATEVADWGADPRITGAFTFPRPGAGWAPSTWARPVAGTLFFAGEATWAAGPPSVHGAVASGKRAAGEVLAAWGTAATAPRAEVTEVPV
jgi:monoamine oxidase